MTDAPNQRPSPRDADRDDSGSDPKPAQDLGPTEAGSLDEAARKLSEPEGAAREAIDRATAPVGTDEDR